MRDGQDRHGGSTALLEPDEPDAAAVVNPSGRSSFLLIGDHAGQIVPRVLADLGLGEAELSRHIGWDIGIAELGARLAAALDAVFIRQVYSRLVIDCNRAPWAPDAIPEVSDGTMVPGNAALDAAARAARVDAIHAPYHAAIAAEIARRTAGGQMTQLVALHSFTSVMRGVVRPWHCGILHDGANDMLATTMLAVLRADPALTVGDNAPYAMDAIDYTVPHHAFAAGLPYVEIEIRQDLLRSPAGIAEWSARLAAMLPAALDLGVASPT
jgi:predicted N-formylglutamate amidohydrolase